MSTVFPTCLVCARFQGRVYCISGKDKRFIPLFGENSPLSRGYALVHPNCRHEIGEENFVSAKIEGVFYNFLVVLPCNAL